jgi:3-methyladenine DNA glycosylase Tag
MPRESPPKRVKPRDLAGYLEVLARAMFQAGISWRVVDAKWDGITGALQGFDPQWLAELGPSEIDALLADPRLIRNRAKLESLADNAQAMLELDAEHRGFRRYLRSLDSFEAQVADLKRQFRFLGDTGAYYFLYVVGEPVPSHEQWSARSKPKKSSARSQPKKRSVSQTKRKSPRTPA